MSKLGTLLWNVVTWILFLACVGWMFWSCFRRSDDRRRLVTKWIGSSLLVSVVLFVVCPVVAGGGPGAAYGILLGAVCGVFLGVLWAPNLASLLASPITSAFDGGQDEVEPAPFYAIAQARRKRGEYLEAIAEVEKQLERFPTDYPGWLLLAEIQAENLNDAATAQKTIEQLIQQPGHTPKNVAHALNRLADWQLKLAHDPEAARAALERVIQLFPDLPEAHAAGQRIAHLGTPQFLSDQAERPRIAVPKFEQNIGLKAEMVGAQPRQETPEATVERYVEHLTVYPQDNEVREQLALLYAEHYRRRDLALDQLEQLIAQPNVPPKQIVHWLNTVADVHIKLAGDVDAARQALQRIQDLFPRTASAEKARVRSAFLNVELKGTKKSQALKLGSDDSK